MIKRKNTPPRMFPISGSHKIATLLVREGHVPAPRVPDQEVMGNALELDKEKAGVFFAHLLYHYREENEKIAS